MVPSLNFGDGLPRLTQRTLRLTVHSLSGISSDVGVTVARYFAPDARTLDDVSSQLSMQAVGVQSLFCPPSAFAPYSYPIRTLAPLFLFLVSRSLLFPGPFSRFPILPTYHVSLPHVPKPPSFSLVPIPPPPRNPNPPTRS